MNDLATLLSPTQNCTCAALRRASRALSAHYEEHFRGSGMRGTQFTVLSAIIQTGAISVSRLAEILGMERTTLTRVLHPLKEERLIKISGNGDGRVRNVSVTARGATATRKALPHWKKAQASAREVLAAFHLPLVKEFVS